MIAKRFFSIKIPAEVRLNNLEFTLERINQAAEHQRLDAQNRYNKLIHIDKRIEHLQQRVLQLELQLQQKNENEP